MVSPSYRFPRPSHNGVSKMLLSTISSFILSASVIEAASKPALSPQVHRELLLNGPPQIGLWQALLKEEAARAVDEELLQLYLHWHPSVLMAACSHSQLSQQPFSAVSKYEAQCHYQPISHFSTTPNTTFCQRYWMDASSYKEGGPVFLLDGGETSGADRLVIFPRSSCSDIAGRPSSFALGSS